MRSPADAAPAGRIAVEWALRVAALALLAWALWLELRPAPAAAEVERAGAGDLRERLARWTRTPGVDRAHAALDAVPPDTLRDWLRAVRGAGVTLGWSAPPLPGVALAIEPVADPLRPVRLLVAAPAGQPLQLADDGGPLDSVAAPRAGASLVTPLLVGVARARVGSVTAVAAPADSLVLRDVVVLARAGWEGKFVAAALEERGWTVITRFAVAPGVSVTQGTVAPLDTGRVAAVIALDTTAADQAAAIARYVRTGGGLVLGAEAAAVPALAALAPGRLATALGIDSDSLAGPLPRHGLPLRPVVGLAAGALPIERRDAHVAVAARRVGAGRVVQLGYAETWRWRMAGGDGSPRAHRDWWAGVVAAAAHAPAVPRAAAGAAPRLDGAPVARLIAALGPAAEAPAEQAADGPVRAPWWVFAAVVAALLAEWASRRQRGAR